MIIAGSVFLTWLGGYVGFALASNIAQRFQKAGKYEDKKITKNDLTKGDHICVPGSVGYGVKLSTGSAAYFHHGIYLGDNQVADFGRANHDYPVIGSFDEFSMSPNGSDKFVLYKREYNTKHKIKDEESASIAITICETKKWDRYSLVRNNCEHFATIVKLNKHWSDQINNKFVEEPIYKQLIEPIKPISPEVQKEISNDAKVALGGLGGALGGAAVGAAIGAVFGPVGSLCGASFGFLFGGPAGTMAGHYSRN